MSPRKDSPEAVLLDENVQEAIARGVILIEDNQVTYYLKTKKSYDWRDPEEWVRARTVAYLVIVKGYPATRMRPEVQVPRRIPSDFADLVIYADDRCQTPFLVVENKSAGQSKPGRKQGIEQAFGNANSLRARFVLYDEHVYSDAWDVASHPPMERERNKLGSREAVPELYGQAPQFRYIAGSPTDVRPGSSVELETKIRRAHSIIWAGGRRDPLTAFDEWSKLLFAKVMDERRTPCGKPRQFQVGTNDTSATVATRVHRLFGTGCKDDPTIFQPGTRIRLGNKKVLDVVRIIQDVSFIRTDVDSIGRAFEDFFGSVFRGSLGQYFTMRQIARFTVAMVGVTHEDYVIDPTAGSGGFLLEALLQAWHRISDDYAGFPDEEQNRLRYDFAKERVYGIEIHDVLSRICKINLLLHHDGHTNIEGDRSCLDNLFTRPRLNLGSSICP